ncbi:MAG: hypothetical protein AAGA86_08515 [Bacteroidota bacterium]
MKKGNLFSLGTLCIGLIFLWSCSSDDNEAPPDNGENSDGGENETRALKEGYIIQGNLDGTVFIQYFEELPSETIDVSQGNDFQSFNVESVLDGAMYVFATDGSNGIEKIIVNQAGELEVVGEIATVGRTFSLSVRDSELGVFHDVNNPTSLTTFNPTTMEVTGSIDMSLIEGLGREPGSIDFTDYGFRGGNELIVTLNATPRLTGVPRVIVDLNTMQATDISVFEGSELTNPPVVFTNSYFDENGNYYGPNFGSEGITTISGGLLKIPAGQNNYDQAYNFQIPLQNNPELAFLGAYLRAFEYFENNKAYALINGSLDPRIDEIIFVENEGNFANIDQNELNEILFLLSNSPTVIWVELDVVTMEITKIEGVPNLPVFTGGGFLSVLDSQPHLVVSTRENNALYRHTGNGTAQVVFEATGAALGEVIDLAQDFQ